MPDLASPAYPADAPPVVGYRHLPTLLPLAITVLALFFVNRTLNVQEEATLTRQFQAHAARLHDRLRERISTYDEILRGAAGFVAASQSVSRAEWRDYVTALALDEGYVGIQGLGFSQRIQPADLEAHVRGVRAEGFPEYDVTPPGSRPVYSAIVYLEPFYGRNLRAFGFDMYSEPVRRAAMDRATGTADIAYSGKVRLVQETDSDVQPGVLAYLPVYSGGRKPSTEALRRANVVGWVYAPFRLKDLVTAVLQTELNVAQVQLYDLGPDGGARPELLFDSLSNHDAAVTPATATRLVHERRMTLHGREWLLRYRALDEFTALNRHDTRWLIMTGVGLIGILLCVLSWVWINTRERARRMADELTTALAEGEERFRLMVASLQDYAVLMLDEQGIVMTWNAGAQRIYGWRNEEITGRHFSFFYPEEAVRAAAPAQALATALVNGQYSEDGWRMRKDGSRFRASVLITAMRDGNGRVKGFTKVTRDITSRHEQEERLRLAATVFRSTQEGVAITDSGGHVLAVNPAFERITEYTEDEVRGQNLRLLASGRHERSYFHTMWRDLLSRGHWQAEIWNRRKGGEVYPGWLTVSAVRNDAGETTSYVGVFTDITRIQHAETQLEHLAHHDALTDLPNRLLLHSRLEHTLERAHRGQTTCAVLFLDLDRFKAVNDQLGHQAGDELLKAASRRLRLHLRENDTVARLGGDEFVIVLEDLASSEGAAVVARAIIERMQQTFHLPGGHEAHVGCSVGISLFPDDGHDADTLIQHADIALYKAKEAGRGTYRFYSTRPE